MRTIGAAVLVGFLAWSAVSARADDSPLEASISVETSNFSKDVTTPKEGKGTDLTITAKYTVSLHNKGMDPLPKIGLKLYLVGRNENDFLQQQFPAKFKAVVVKVMEKTGIALDPAADAVIDLGSCEYQSRVTQLVNWTYFSGIYPEGYALEIYINDEKVDLKIGGNGNVQEAYESYLKKAS